MSVLLKEIVNENVAVLRVNRPDALNALNLEVREELGKHFGELAQDDSIRSVLITGDEKTFAAGADIKVMADKSPMGMQDLAVHKHWATIANFPKPIIASVNGFALGGGCELAMHADIIVAGEGAQFGQPEIKLGIMPGAGGTARLMRLVGAKKAMRLLLTGEIISAQTAYDWGLVSQLTADEETFETALKMATRIAKMGPIAVEHIKETAYMSMDMPLASALTLERRAFHMLFDTEDQKEGMTAFMEKRKANFTGK